MRTRFVSSLLALLLAAASAFNPIAAQNDTPAFIPLQGQLTEQSIGGGANSVAEDGVYTISVRVYQSPTGSEVLWQDTFQNLPVVNGVFNMVLGSQTSLDSITGGEEGEDLLDVLSRRGVLYVGLTITHKDGTNVPQPVEMLPRLTLLPVAFSLKAREAQMAKLADFATQAKDAEFSVNAQLLQGYGIEALVEIPGSTGGSNDTFPIGTKVKGGLLPAGTSLGATLIPGQLIEAIGDPILDAIDPRSLDSNGDGVPDKPLSCGRTVNGEIPPGNYNLWFVCVQNGSGNLRFPDPNADEIQGEAFAHVRQSYSVIPSYLQGISIPNKSFILESVAEPEYEWRMLERVPGDSGLHNGEGRVMVYDGTLDCYWFVSEIGVRIYWREPGEGGGAEKIRGRNLGVIPYSGSGQDLIWCYGLIRDRKLIVGSHGFWGDPNVPISFTITGDTVLNATLTGGAPVTTTGDPNPRRTGHGAFLEPSSGSYYAFGGFYNDSNSYVSSSVLYRYSPSNFSVVPGTIANYPSAHAYILSAFNPNDGVSGIGYAYGGDNSNQNGAAFVANSLRIWDRNTNTWSTASPNPGDTPPPLLRGMGAVNPYSGDFLLLGGQSTKSPDTNNYSGTRHNQMWSYDRQDNRWTQIPTATPGVNWPEDLYWRSHCVDTLRQRFMYVSSAGNMWELRFGGRKATSGTMIKVADHAPVYEPQCP